MTERQHSIRAAADYRNFDNCWSGLAAMILIQAAVDLNTLRGRDRAKLGGYIIYKYELLNFFRSDWAAALSEAMKLDRRSIVRYAERKLC